MVRTKCIIDVNPLNFGLGIDGCIVDLQKNGAVINKVKIKTNRLSNGAIEYLAVILYWLSDEKPLDTSKIKGVY